MLASELKAAIAGVINSKMADLGVTNSTDLNDTQEVAITDAVANYMSTVNPTIKTYPPTTP